VQWHKPIAYGKRNAIVSNEAEHRCHNAEIRAFFQKPKSKKLQDLFLTLIATREQ